MVSPIGSPSTRELAMTLDCCTSCTTHGVVSGTTIHAPCAPSLHERVVRRVSSTASLTFERSDSTSYCIECTCPTREEE